ncbi:hypothetical protein [Polyangium jinanense]|uniref:Uncharacterized protein n=1 Tax=Polyangium jinanense TaxID=2829994 RepID=A0A9X3XH81_9BACT|nr:hypothetical protein [Polyangium jinanense]MDC3959794.1 hypothetical protein [Polyangium jinanense]MDC3988061.1 hypothetical protein [Polyangium jinanense]
MRVVLREKNEKQDINGIGGDTMPNLAMTGVMVGLAFLVGPMLGFLPRRVLGKRE